MGQSKRRGEVKFHCRFTLFLRYMKNSYCQKYLMSISGHLQSGLYWPVPAPEPIFAEGGLIQKIFLLIKSPYHPCILNFYCVTLYNTSTLSNAFRPKPQLNWTPCFRLFWIRRFGVNYDAFAESLFRVFARNKVTKQSALFQQVASFEIASLPFDFAQARPLAMTKFARASILNQPKNVMTA